MKKSLAIAVATVGVFSFAVPTASAVHEAGELTVGLNGSNEVGTQGDRNGSGKIDLAFFDAVDNPTVVFPGEYYVCYELTVRNIDDPTMLHIHEVPGNVKNPRKEAGPVVVDLFADDARTSGDQTCVVVDEEVFDGIQDDPREYYVNAHNAAFPAGAIRGQLHGFN